MGVLSDKEVEAFEKAEMDRHYKEGYCEDRSMCKYCQILWEEEQYFNDIDYWDSRYRDEFGNPE